MLKIDSQGNPMYSNHKKRLALIALFAALNLKSVTAVTCLPGYFYDSTKQVCFPCSPGNASTRLI